MSWEELGIQDPNIRWRGVYQDWRTNRWGDLYEETEAEIEFLHADIDEIGDLGLFKTQVENFTTWLDYIEDLLEMAKNSIKFREDLLTARIELSRFAKQFDAFTIEIEWY